MSIVRDRKGKTVRKKVMSYELAHRLFEYSPKTGVFIQKRRTVDMFEDKGKFHSAEMLCKRWNTLHADTEPTRQTPKGYRVVCVFDLRFLVHQVIWLMMTGKWPKRLIDHRDTNRSNNRWKNLRLATFTQNLANQNARSNNSTGHKGVTHVGNGRYRARATDANGRRHDLGRFGSVEEASAAVKAAVKRFHGEFGRAGVRKAA